MKSHVRFFRIQCGRRSKMNVGGACGPSTFSLLIFRPRRGLTFRRRDMWRCSAKNDNANRSLSRYGTRKHRWLLTARWTVWSDFSIIDIGIIPRIKFGPPTQHSMPMGSWNYTSLPLRGWTRSPFLQNLAMGWRSKWRFESSESNQNARFHRFSTGQHK